MYVVAGIVGVLALLTATFAFVGEDDDDPSAAGEDDVTTTEVDGGPEEPTSPPTDAPPASPEEIEALVAELQAYVEEARDLPFQRDVVVEALDDDEIERRVSEDLEEDRAEIEEVEVLYRALGLLEPGVPLFDAVLDMYTGLVLGFYDPEDDELVVRGRSLGPWVQQTLVHELVHALDDQHFELHRPEYDDAPDEISTGFGAVIEGDARRIENQWIGEQSAEFREEAEAQEQAFAEGIDVSGIPRILLFQLTAPYQYGELLVGQIVSDGGERAVDAAFVDPPDTTEQVLFPELYESREPRVEVPAPPADGEVVDEGVVGALFLHGLLSFTDSGLDPTEALAAVEGWGGDWAVTWTEEDLACVRADFVGDTPGDTDEIEAALSTWAEDREIATVSRVEDRARLESCASTAAGGNPDV